MPTTNKTTNLHLPQYTEGDKIAFLQDINDAFNAVDGFAGEVQGAIGNLTNYDDTQLKAEIARVDAKIAIALAESYADGVHSLTGAVPAEGYFTGWFKASSRYNSGDTFLLGGESYSGQTLAGEAVPDGAFVLGALVLFRADVAAKKLTFDVSKGFDTAKQTAMEAALIAGGEQDLAVAQVRNVTISNADPEGGVNGQLHFKYSE